MFTVVNEFGNVQFTVKTEKERDYFINHGYTEKPKEKEELPKKEGATKNAKRKGKADTKGNI